MRELARPYWIFLTITLPQSILLFLYLSSYLVIRTLMSKESISSWKLYGSLLLLLLAASTVYGIILWIKRKPISKIFGALIFLTYLPLLYIFLMNDSAVIPFNVPRWMFERGDLFLYAFTFLMPAFAHGLVLLVLGLTTDEKDHPLKSTIIGVVIVPAFWYLFVNVGIPLLKKLYGRTHLGFFDSKFMMHVILVLVLISTIVFLFYAVRLVYLILLKKPVAEYRQAYLYKGFLLVVLPVVCFAVYNGALVTAAGMKDLFDFLGDISSPWYYITAGINGVLLSLPVLQNPRLRFALFLAKSVTYSFVFYFFLALLPFLPLAIPAIIAVGLGFLLLTPLLVMVVHTQSLTTDYRFLKEQYGRRSVIAVFMIGFLVLPLGITGKFMQDRIMLNRMLDFVYRPDFSVDSARINLAAARRTLDSIRGDKQRAPFLSERKPYITPFYQWLVLDNMTLSDRKLQVLERIFWGTSDVRVWDRADNSVEGPGPSIVSIKTEATSSKNGEYSRTWVHLGIRNSSSQGQQEYVTRFRLPAGAWISDYYLKIGDERVRGILTDKKSATWVYQQITSEGKDPGILYYTDGGEIMLRIFPFAAGETRYTGFELVHRGPIRMNIGDQTIAFRGKERDEAMFALNGDVIYIPQSVKAKLPQIHRKPYYNFILDCSVDTEKRKEAYIGRIRKFLSSRRADRESARITVANYQTKTFDMKDGWEDEVTKFPGQGGFFLERAMKNTLFRNYQELSRRYPVFVVVSDNPVKAIFVEDLNGFIPLLPEINFYYELGLLGELKSRPLTGRQFRQNGRHIDKTADHVLAWPDDKNPVAFLPDDKQASIVLRPDAGISPMDLKDASWENGLVLEGMSRYRELYPSKSEPLRLALIKNSFRTRILTPHTSFLSLENEAQRQALLRKQEKVLSANKSLDIGEERQMSEPSLYMMLILLFLSAPFYFLVRKREAREK